MAASTTTSGNDLASRFGESAESQIPNNIDLSSLEYDMKTHKGYAIIFNHNLCKGFEREGPRIGTFEDADRLERCLKKLNFDVDVETDKNYNEIYSIMEEVKNKKNISCLIVVVMTHGGESPNFVRAKDKPYFLPSLWIQLMGELQGIPKLFFIQACRGEKTDHGFTQQDTRPPTKDISDINFPMNADILKVYSTSEDYFSYRENYGSWFVTEMCEVFDKYAEKLELLHMLTIINKRVAENYFTKGIKINDEEFVGRAMPQFVSHLTKSLKFNVLSDVSKI